MREEEEGAAGFDAETEVDEAGLSLSPLDGARGGAVGLIIEGLGAEMGTGEGEAVLVSLDSEV